MRLAPFAPRYDCRSAIGEARELVQVVRGVVLREGTIEQLFMKKDIPPAAFFGVIAFVILVVGGAYLLATQSSAAAAGQAVQPAVIASN